MDQHLWLPLSASQGKIPHKNSRLTSGQGIILKSLLELGHPEKVTFLFVPDPDPSQPLESERGTENKMSFNALKSVFRFAIDNDLVSKTRLKTSRDRVDESD